MRVPVRAYTYDEMIKRANPPAGIGVSEAFHTQFYDTQTYPAGGTTAPINFFQTTNADLTLSNMQAAGQFPSPQFFQLYAVAFEVLLPPASAAVPAAWTDLFNIRIGSRGFLVLTISDKDYGRIPLRALHPSGGMSGFGYQVAAVAATATEWAQGAPLDGGFWHDGAIWFPPNTNFSVRVEFQGVLQPVTNATLIRVVLDGILHRRIL